MVRYKNRILKGFLVAFFLCGCTGTQGLQTGKATDPTIVKRYIDAEYLTAFNACTQALFSLGYRIRHYDREQGVLVGFKFSDSIKKRVFWGSLFGLAGGYVNAQTNEKIHLRLVQTDKKDATAVYFQVLMNGQPEIHSGLVESFWIVAQREALLEKGGRVPAELEKNYRAIRQIKQSKGKV